SAQKTRIVRGRRFSSAPHELVYRTRTTQGRTDTTMGFSGMRVIGLAAAAVAMLSGSAGAVEWRSTSSLIDTGEETETFERYSYVNPDAPKGGQLNSIATGTFDSFNPFIV